VQPDRPEPVSASDRRGARCFSLSLSSLVGSARSLVRSRARSSSRAAGATVAAEPTAQRITSPSASGQRKAASNCRRSQRLQCSPSAIFRCASGVKIAWRSS
jgi:hypothetical protein